MRGTVAKRIRREVYGDHSIHQRNYYGRVVDKLMELFKEGKRKVLPLTVVDRGLRSQYQAAKKAYYAGV